MDLGWSYHVPQRKEYFETLKLELGGVVLLGDHKACKVYGIGIMILKMVDDCESIYTIWDMF